MSHDHDCFLEIARSRNAMIARGERTGFYLYVSNDRDEDAHYRGNTAFAAKVFGRLARDIEKTHTYGSCTHCDTVAAALKAAREAFNKVMAATPGAC